MPKRTLGGRNLVRASRRYRDDQNKKHRHNLRKKQANNMFNIMARTWR